jgi:anti-sigma regulatory factor (Ser/Thr protein kinase)
MQDLSLHILDIAENSIEARARKVEVRLTEDSQQDRLVLEIEDDGQGMDQETKQQALNPFFSTKTTRRIGLGLPLLAEAARAAAGWFTLDSQPGRGTHIKAVFQLSHIDCKPLGDIAQTLVALILGNPRTDFVYRHSVNGKHFEFDTRDIRKERKGVALSSPEIMRFINKTLQEGLASIRRKS